MKRNDLEGVRFGRLVVIGPAYTQKIGSQTRLFWNLKCDCGNEHVATGNNLKKGYVTSCGCVRHRMEESSLVDPNIRGLRKVFNNYRYNAKQRGYSFDLTMSDVEYLIHQPCHYCGRSDTQYMTVTNKHLPFAEFRYTGMDRIDNSVGYEIGNVVPCCTVCNRGKNGMGYEEFLDYLDAVARNRK